MTCEISSEVAATNTLLFSCEWCKPSVNDNIGHILYSPNDRILQGQVTGLYGVANKGFTYEL